MSLEGGKKIKYQKEGKKIIIFVNDMIIYLETRELTPKPSKGDSLATG